MKKNKIIFATALLLFLVLGAVLLGEDLLPHYGKNLVSAQDKSLEVEYPEILGYKPETVTSSLPEYVNYIFNFAVWIVGAFALGALVYGGFRYLTSAGSSAAISDAKNRIFAGLLGLIILLSAYFILNTINPQLTILKVPIREAIEIEEIEEFKLSTITTSINVELPVESLFWERNKGVFGEVRLEKIKEVAADTEETASDSVGLCQTLKGLTEQCYCGPESESVVPVCENCCCAATEDGACYSCGCHCGCTSDPCHMVRGKISTRESELQEKIKDFLSLQEKSSQEAEELAVGTDRLKRALEIMKEDCQLWGALSRDQFISNKDYYEQQGWRLKKIRYFNEITVLLANSSADFYCPIGGNQSAYIPQPDINTEELEGASEEFQEYLGEGGGIFETVVSCSTPIPFGEIADKGIGLIDTLKNKIEELIELNQKMIEAINRFVESVNECTSDNCDCTCGCTGAGCSCELITDECSGNPCPNISTGEVAGISSQIKNKRIEIDKFINEDISDYLNSFGKIAERIHGCVAEPSQIEPGWLLLDCERAIGTVGPDREILGGEGEEKEDCKCRESDECRAEFEEIGNYQCQVIEDCHYYNFYCCRIKD